MLCPGLQAPRTATYIPLQCRLLVKYKQPLSASNRNAQRGMCYVNHHVMSIIITHHLGLWHGITCSGMQCVSCCAMRHRAHGVVTATLTARKRSRRTPPTAAPSHRTVRKAARCRDTEGTPSLRAAQGRGCATEGTTDGTTQSIYYNILQ